MGWLSLLRGTRISRLFGLWSLFYYQTAFTCPSACLPLLHKWNLHPQAAVRVLEFIHVPSPFPWNYSILWNLWINLCGKLVKLYQLFWFRCLLIMIQLAFSRARRPDFLVYVELASPGFLGCGVYLIIKRLSHARLRAFPFCVELTSAGCLGFGVYSPAFLRAFPFCVELASCSSFGFGV